MAEKNYEMTIDTNGVITALAVAGKAVAMRDLNKAQTAPFWKLYTEPQIARNPFSGVEMELDPLEFSIFTFCLRWYKAYENGLTKLPIQVYDSMKYLLLNIDADAYFNLLN
jgi:hypothetical protein